MKLLPLIFFTIISSQLFAQKFKFKLHFPDSNYPQFSHNIPAYEDLAFDAGDIDNDGDEDIVIGGRLQGGAYTSRKTQIFLNDGLGNYYLDTINTLLQTQCQYIKLLDLDGDGDLDIIHEGLNDETVSPALYLNDDFGNFTLVENSPFHKDADRLVFGDIDQDGDYDIYSASMKTFFQQDSTLKFTRLKNSVVYYGNSTFSSSNLLEDIDGDGDLDLITIGSINPGMNHSHIYLNDSNNFKRAFKNLGPYSGKAFIEDIDMDGDMDIFISGSHIDNGAETLIYWQDSLGNFVKDSLNDWSNLHGAGASLLDTDGDGDLDLTFATFVYFQYYSNYLGYNQTLLYENNGKGLFNFATQLPFKKASKPFLINADGDSLLDILYVGGEYSFGSYTVSATEVLKNYGDNKFIAAKQSTIKGMTKANYKTIDYDNDGDLDFFMMGDNRYGKGELQGYENRGDGLFDPIDLKGIKHLRNGGFAIGDLTGNGLLDIVITGSQYDGDDKASFLCINKGGGDYRLKSLTPPMTNSMVEIFDIDNDGDLDFIISGKTDWNYEKLLYIYKNNGSGSFVKIEKDEHGITGYADGNIYTIDYDLDGDTDFIIKGQEQGSSYDTKIRLYDNDGKGNFSVTDKLDIASSLISIGDINGDKYPDILLYTPDNYSSITPKILMNQKDGTFKEELHPEFPGGFAIVADFDGDRDGDILFMDKGGWWGVNGLIFMENNGDGSFTSLPAEGFPEFANHVPMSACAADFTGNGTPDLIVSGLEWEEKQSSYFYKNETCPLNPWPKETKACYMKTTSIEIPKGGSSPKWSNNSNEDSISFESKDYEEVYWVDYQNASGCAIRDSFSLVPDLCGNYVRLQGRAYINYYRDDYFDEYNDDFITGMPISLNQKTVYTDSTGYFSFLSEKGVHSESAYFHYDYDVYEASSQHNGFANYQNTYEDSDTILYPFYLVDEYYGDLAVTAGMTNLDQGENGVLSVSVKNLSHRNFHPSVKISTKGPIKLFEKDLNNGVTALEKEFGLEFYPSPFEAFETKTFYFEIGILEGEQIENRMACFEIELNNIDGDKNYYNDEFILCDSLSNTRATFHKEASITNGLMFKNQIYSLDYVIKFQNTTGSRVNKVIIVDTLDAEGLKMNPTLQSSSHYCTMSIENNIVKWVFEDINLPDINMDSVRSNGFINLSCDIKTYGVPEHKIYSNTAQIYFDNEFVGSTTIAENFFQLPLPTSAEIENLTFVIYPTIVDAGGLVTIKYDFNEAPFKIDLFDITGKLVKSFLVGKSDINSIQIPDIPADTYFLHIKDVAYKIIVRK